MSQFDLKPINPYQAPALPQKSAEEQQAEIQNRIKACRNQILALGGAWIIVGMVTALFGGAMMYVAGDNTRHFALGLSYFTLGVGWTGLGFFTCLGRRWAIYAGLALSYAALLTSLLKRNDCGITLVVILVLYAHWGISRAKRMTAIIASLNPTN